MGLFSFLKKNKEKVEHVTGPYLEIDSEKCKGEKCARCVSVCPNNAFIIEEGKVVLKEYYTCRNCRMCVGVCPNHAILII